MRFFLFIAYDGANYHGWQTQPNGVSVQETVEGALETLLREKTLIVGAGRTDAGVHARRMVAHFDLTEEKFASLAEAASPFGKRAEDWLADKLNRLLPPDISVLEVRRVRDDAHARFDACARTYCYYVSLEKGVFDRNYSMRLFNGLDFERMNEAASCLLQYIDFTSFSKLHTDVKTNDCRVSFARWSQLDESRWVFTITADRFLRNMVRAVVGTLIAVGRGQLSVKEFCEIIERKDRCSAGESVPAQGLFLERVDYPESVFLNDVSPTMNDNKPNNESCN
ncbi:MAG: tRNA pseudouridine(38-40) synthase TruA [Bacteroidaceae bacterium]|nr:tRNA pseudouridine(38-40) synthase TruA [Bacteroidaceae bacterium]